MSPRSSPMNMTVRAFRSPTREVSAAPLSTPGGRSSSTNRPSSTCRSCRAAMASSAGRRFVNAAVGSRICAYARRRTGPCPRPGLRPAERRSSTAARAGDDARMVRRGRHLAGRRVPALGAIVTEHEQPVTGGSWSRPAYSTASAAGRPVMIATVPMRSPSWRSTGRRRQGTRRAGSATIGASVPSKSSPTSARAGSARSAARPALPADVVGVREAHQPAIPRGTPCTGSPSAHRRASAPPAAACGR